MGRIRELLGFFSNKYPFIFNRLPRLSLLFRHLFHLLSQILKPHTEIWQIKSHPHLLDKRSEFIPIPTYRSRHSVGSRSFPCPRGSYLVEAPFHPRSTSCCTSWRSSRCLLKSRIYVQNRRNHPTPSTRASMHLSSDPY